MKRSWLNEDQIIAILKEQEAGVATAEVSGCRKLRRRQRDECLDETLSPRWPIPGS